MFVLYSLLYSAALLLLLPFEYFKRPRELRGRWLRERMGSAGAASEGLDSKPVWIHAVSVGEVIAAAPFIAGLKERHPSLPVVLSTVTDTGQKVAREKLAGAAEVFYLPFDLVFIVRRAMRRLRPALFVAIETELWPNIFRTCKKEGVPVLVLNGRLSEKSFRGYRKIRFFISRVLSRVDLFCMQEKVYQERIKALGVEEDRVRVTGNFKFDIKPSGTLPEWAGSLGSPVVVAGSTHEGEEELIISVFSELNQDFPGLNLVLAPRHPERFGRVETLVKERGLPCVRRSALARGSQLIAHRSEGNFSYSQPSAMSHELSAVGRRLSGTVFLLDTIGELASAYGVADVAIIGGSFVERGGHNPLEPAFWGKPVVCGPHMENFPFIADFYGEKGAIETDAERLSHVLKELIRSPQRRKAWGEKARSLYNDKVGAVARSVEVLERYLDAELPLAEEKPLS